MDLVAGLHWLRENLPAFGGDPERVTLMGHGTGAALVNFIAVSPVAKGKCQMNCIRGVGKWKKYAGETVPFPSNVLYNIPRDGIFCLFSYWILEKYDKKLEKFIWGVMGVGLKSTIYRV